MWFIWSERLKCPHLKHSHFIPKGNGYPFFCSACESYHSESSSPSFLNSIQVKLNSQHLLNVDYQRTFWLTRSSLFFLLFFFKCFFFFLAFFLYPSKLLYIFFLTFLLKTHTLLLIIMSCKVYITALAHNIYEIRGHLRVQRAYTFKTIRLYKYRCTQIQVSESKSTLNAFIIINNI